MVETINLQEIMTDDTMIMIFLQTYNCLLWISDPDHHRANGNLKYFEFQLEKQRTAEAEKKEVEDKKREKKVLDKRDTERKRSKDPLPERQKYEMLCRGEGVKLVSRKVVHPPYFLHILNFLSYSFFCLLY